MTSNLYVPREDIVAPSGNKLVVPERTKLVVPKKREEAPAILLHDPPGLKRLSERGDPPSHEWPGTVRTRLDVAKSTGDARDWFRYRHREEAFLRVWNEWADARSRRRDMSAGFDWDQVLIIGAYGSGKTTLGIMMALHYFKLGHCVFSNAACLFGWHLELEEMYTALGMMPKNSVLLIDEGSAMLSSRMAAGVAVSTFAEMNLNTRKQNAKIIYMTAKDWDLAPSVRRETRAVWMPIPKDKITYVGAKAENVHPANDPYRFMPAWYEWDDYPYTKGNIIEGKDKDKGGTGFGTPGEIYRARNVNLVRDSFLLTDTFELAQAGAATIANREMVKEGIKTYHKVPGSGRSGMPISPRHAQTAQLMEYIRWIGDRPDAPEYITPRDVSSNLGISPQAAGSLISVFGVPFERGKGYRTEAILDIWAQEEANMDMA